MNTQPEPIKSVLNPEAIYSGDNGRLFCGSQRCAGATARASGRDLSGQPVYMLTPDDAAELERMIDRRPTCEICRKPAPRVWVS